MKFSHETLFYFLVLAYFTYLIVTIGPDINALEANQALKGVLYNKYITNQSINYLNYPTKNVLYEPIYPLINSVLFPNSVFLMKLLNALLSVLTIIISYYLLKELFANNDVALLGSAFSVSAPLIINSSRMIIPEVLSTLLFVAGLFFVFKKDSNKKLFMLAGLFFGLSIIVSSSALIYVICFIIMSLIHLRKNVKKLTLLYATLIAVLIPYAVLIFYSGDLNTLIESFNLTSFNFLSLIMSSYSIAGLLLFIAGIYFYYKQQANKKIIVFLIISLILSSKTILYIIPLMSGIIAVSALKIYSLINKDKIKLAYIFLITLFLILPLTYAQKINSPVPILINDLINSCPNCKILIATESLTASSSNLMFEALIKNSSMSFIRPVNDVTLVVNLQKIDRVILITPKNNDLIPKLVMNRYSLISYYNEEFYVYNTK